MSPRFTLTGQQSQALVSTLVTLGIGASIDLRQEPSGDLLLTVYHASYSDPIVYEITGSGYVRELAMVPA